MKSCTKCGDPALSKFTWGSRTIYVCGSHQGMMQGAAELLEISIVLVPVSDWDAPPEIGRSHWSPNLDA